MTIENKIPGYWANRLLDSLTPNLPFYDLSKQGGKIVISLMSPSAYIVHTNWPLYPDWMKVAMWTCWPLVCPESAEEPFPHG